MGSLWAMVEEDMTAEEQGAMGEVVAEEVTEGEVEAEEDTLALGAIHFDPVQRPHRNSAINPSDHNVVQRMGDARMCSDEV